MGLRSRIATPEAVNLLEEAQCATQSETSSILQNLTLRLHTPHPTVTSALHDLLQIHPLQTIPHVPALIPGTPAVVAQFVESFSDLLSADRTLLVPIIGALSDLPLSDAHATQSRATLHYALSVVDSHDLPAVVRALARLCANSKASSSARWAANALRNALAKPPADDVIPVLTHVFEEVCRPGNHVGAALRAQAGMGIVIWVDIVVWCHAIKAKNGPYASGYNEAMSSLLAAVKGPLLSGNRDLPVMAIKTAVPSLHNWDGVRVFVSIIVDELAKMGVLRLELVVNFAILVYTLVKAVPTTARDIVQELLVPERSRFVAAETAVIGIMDILPREARQMAVASRNPRVKVAALASEGDDSSGWSSVFVTLRKTLVFGMSEERARGLDLARAIVRDADPEVVGELLSIMENSISGDLGDELAVGFLEIVTAAILRGIVSAEDASRTLERRIEKHCPSEMVKEVLDESDGTGQARGRQTLHIDVGLIWDHDPAAVAVVVSSAASLMLASRDVVSSEGISMGLLNVLCLVPVVCIPLYTAVEDCAMEFDTTFSAAKSSRGAKPRTKDIPPAIIETSNRDLATAISSLAVAMSAIIGILNTSCSSLVSCQRVLDSRRHRPALRNATDQRVVWHVLERLMEFDRMFNALLLGYEVLQMKCANWKKIRRNGKPKAVPNEESGSDSASTAFGKARAIRSAVLTGIGTSIGVTRDSLEDMSHLNAKYPRLSLQAVLFSLVAVPDEEGIADIGNIVARKQTRDTELVRIDKLLLRQLLCLMIGRAMGKRGGRGKREAEAKMSRNPGAGSGMESDNLNSLKRIQQAINEVSAFTSNFPYINMDIDKHENLFVFENEDFSDEENDEEEENDIAVIRWVCPTQEESTRCAEFVRSSTNLATQNQWGSPKHNIGICAGVLHSPAFASFLLDRAATYVAVARSGRGTGVEDSYLSNVVTVAGFALGCLNALLRVLPSCALSGSYPRSSEWCLNASAGKDVKAFFEGMDRHLITGVPEVTEDILKDWFKASGGCGQRVIRTICWISENSIDAAVSALALESLLIVAELGCFRPGLARNSILSSLATVYEYDSDYLWSSDDLSILFQEPYGEWSLRRRGDPSTTMAFIAESAASTSEPAPWVIPLSKGLKKQKKMNRYRLHMFFEAMNVSNALLEASGWIREIAIAMLCTNDNEKDTPSSTGKVSFYAEMGMDVADSRVSSRHDSSRCTTLLETTGFTEVMATLLQLVQTSLHSLALPEGFNIDDALSFRSNPVAQWQSAVSILCGILRLNIMCRESLSTRDDAGEVDDGPSGPDHDFDHYIISSASSVMQLVCTRLAELHAWCLDADYVTDIPKLSDAVIEGFEKFVGSAALAVSYCSDLCGQLKCEYSSFATRSTDGAKERIPSKRKTFGEEHVSRARRIIPRLSSQCDSVTRETSKLANLMGFRTKKALFKLAPPPLEDDPGLCFGVGLDLKDGGDIDCEDVDVKIGNVDTSTSDICNTKIVKSAATDGDVTMHTHGAANEIVTGPQAKPVTIRFK